MTDIDWRVLKSNADAERAQLNRILADIRDTINTSAESTLLQANATSTLTTEQGLSGMATAWRDTNARVTRNGNNITALAEDITFLSARVDDIETGESGNAEAIQLLSARVDSNEDGITANANSLLKLGALTPDGSAFLLNSGTVLVSPSQSLAQWRSELNTSLDDKASSSTVTELSNTVSEQGGLITAQGQQLSGLSATVGDVQASVVQYSSALVEGSGGNKLINPGFETNGLTGWSRSGTGASSRIYVTTGDVNSGFRCVRFNGDAGGDTISLINDVRVPHVPGRTYRFGMAVQRAGSSPNSDARLNICLRAYRADGSYHSTGYGRVIIAPGDFGYDYGTVESSVTAGTSSNNAVAYYTVQIYATNHTQGAWTVDDVFLEPLSSAESRAMATWGFSVSAGGKVTGMKATASDTESVIDFQADAFRVSSSGSTGLSWDQGALWNRRGSYSMIAGPDLGENMLFYIGTTPSSPSAARKANAIFYVDSNGTGYFAGQVLQGVLRAFNSNTTVGSSATVSTGSISSNNKPVQVVGRFQYSAFQAYNGFSSNITLGGGTTRAVVALERRYGSGSWTELTRRTIVGGEDVVNLSDGPSTIEWSMAGDLVATDTASLQNREYRTRVISLSRRAHSVSNPGTAPAMSQSQYQSIESME